MEIRTILQTELTDSERGVLRKDSERWKRLGQGAHLDEWLAFGDGLMIRRRLAMRLAHTNKPEGKGYVQAFKKLIEADGLHTMDKTSMTAVLWLHDDSERLNTLREIRETMTVGERSRLNSPISARQRVEKILKVRDAGTEPELRTSPVARLKEQTIEQAREIAYLQERLAASEQRDGSLFDLKQDTVDAICDVIMRTVTLNRAKALADGLAKRLKNQKTAAG